MAGVPVAKQWEWMVSVADYQSVKDKKQIVVIPLCPASRRAR